MAIGNKGNKHATGRKSRAPDLINRIRIAFDNGMTAFESRNDASGKRRLISEVMADEFEKSPLKYMEAASKVLPKEIQADISQVYDANKLTDDEILAVLAARDKAESKENSDDQLSSSATKH